MTGKEEPHNQKVERILHKNLGDVTQEELTFIKNLAEKELEWREESKRMAKFWMLYVKGRSIPKVCHLSDEEALQEAARLARLPENVGRRVYLLEAVKYCFVDGTAPPPLLVWQRLDER